MRLLTKTTLYIATLSLFLFFIMGIIFFQVLKITSIKEFNREMRAMRAPVERNFPLILKSEISCLPGLDTILISAVDEIPDDLPEFTDTVLFDARTDQHRTCQVHSFTTRQDSALYLVRLIRSTTPSDTLVERVTLMMTIMVILFLSGIFILNRYMFSSLWKDFFTALDKLKNFDAEKGALIADDSDIEEFTELNAVLEKLTARLSRDYRDLRQYTDHTTHEIQTPLAIIKSKVELLLQSENLRKDEAVLITDIYKNADHLSRLTSTLAMFTRIDNQQYKEEQEVDMNSLVHEQVEMMQELIDLKNIHVNMMIPQEKFIVKMDRGLAGVLVINLLKNAINHNVDDGIIEIELSDNRLTVKNSGEVIQPDPHRIFDRFVRGPGKSESLGLGLPLVRKICDHYGFSVDYRMDGKLHLFIVSFLVQE